MYSAPTVISMVESIVARSNDDITIAHLSYIKHVAHTSRRYSALLLKLTVKDHDTSVTTATPELLVDDTQTLRHYWQWLLCLFRPLFQTGLL